MEIERKFLVDKKQWALLKKPEGTKFIQGYLSIDAKKIIRVRVTDGLGFLTIKGSSDSISRPEYEYTIPMEEARDLIRLFTPTHVEKARTKIQAGKYTWEVDEFLGENEGLLLAEIELEDPGDVFEMPAWLGEEVTGDERYYNAYLSLHPFRTW